MQRWLKIGLGLSADKRQTHTFLRTLTMPPEKVTRLAAFHESFFDRPEASLSNLASLRGRVQHYSACLPHVLPY
jgi:hypothetical protein